MMKIAISLELVGLPWQHLVPDGIFRHGSMVCSIISFSCQKIINLIKNLGFFSIGEAKNGPY